MKQKTIPSQIHPDLRMDRLTTLKQLIEKQLEDIVDKCEEDRGDNPWSNGCRAYAWICKAIRNASHTNPDCSQWLKVLEDSGLYFTFMIGNVPIKFYTGDIENLPTKITKNSGVEKSVRQGAFPFIINDDSDFLFRIIIDKNHEGLLKNVSLVQVDSYCNCIDAWNISDQDSNIIPLKSDSVELPKAKTTIRKSVKKEAKGDNRGNE